MYDKSAAFYDLIYDFKDYHGEATALAALIRARRPEASRVLDVACGTHEHGRFFKDMFAEVDGVDLNAEFIEAAQAKNPSGRYSVGDMRAFDLGRRYDAVLCLFSAIGYAGSPEEIDQAVARMAAHAEPGGVVVVEPWWTPEAYFPGRLSANTAEGDGVRLCRMARSELLDGGVAYLNMHYLVGDADGVRHFTEEHRLQLVSTDRMRAAFEAAGLATEHDPQGLIGRGLWIGVKPSEI